MPAKTLSCPHCGLTLTVKPSKTDTRLTYDINEWKRRCKHPDLDSPVRCLVEKDTKGRKH